MIYSSKKTIKLEGAELKGYRSITIGGIRDPIAIMNLDKIEEEVRKSIDRSLRGILSQSEYSLHFLRYGLDGVTNLIKKQSKLLPEEIAFVIESIAPTQELADTVLSLARSTALHQSFPHRKTTAGNLAFPFSPSDFQGGPVYEFSIYHLMKIEETSSLFPVTFEEI